MHHPKSELPSSESYVYESNRSIIYDSIDTIFPDGGAPTRDDAEYYLMNTYDMLVRENYLTDSAKKRYLSDQYAFSGEIRSDMLTPEGRRFMVDEYPTYRRNQLMVEEADLQHVGAVEHAYHVPIDPIKDRVVIVPYWLAMMINETSGYISDVISQDYMSQLSSHDRSVFNKAQCSSRVRQITKLLIRWDKLMIDVVHTTTGETTGLENPGNREIYIGRYVGGADHMDITYQTDVYYKDTRYHILLVTPSDTPMCSPQKLHDRIADQLYGQNKDPEYLFSLGFLGPTYRRFPENSIV